MQAHDLRTVPVRERAAAGGWMGGCEGVFWGEGDEGTPTQGGTPLEDGEQISFKVDRSIAASSLCSAHLKYRIKYNKVDWSN